MKEFFKDPPKLPQLVWDEYERILKRMEVMSGSPLNSLRFVENRYVPKDEIWMVDSLGAVRKIINIGNALADNAAISLCVGEMK